MHGAATKVPLAIAFLRLHVSGAGPYIISTDLQDIVSQCSPIPVSQAICSAELSSRSNVGSPSS